VVFLYLVTTSAGDHLRAFAQRHAGLLCALPGWTLRLLVQPHASRLTASIAAVARDELTMRFCACHDRRAPLVLRTVLGEGRSTGESEVRRAILVGSRCLLHVAMSPALRPLVDGRRTRPRSLQRVEELQGTLRPPWPRFVPNLLRTAYTIWDTTRRNDHVLTDG